MAVVMFVFTLLQLAAALLLLVYEDVLAEANAMRLMLCYIVYVCGREREAGRWVGLGWGNPIGRKTKWSSDILWYTNASCLSPSCLLFGISMPCVFITYFLFYSTHIFIWMLFDIICWKVKLKVCVEHLIYNGGGIWRDSSIVEQNSLYGVIYWKEKNEKNIRMNLVLIRCDFASGIWIKLNKFESLKNWIKQRNTSRKSFLFCYSAWWVRSPTYHKVVAIHEHQSIMIFI